MSAGWKVVFFAAAVLAFAVGAIVSPPDRLRQPVFWICAGLLFVAVVFAFDAAVAASP